jgi:hypothetical protein
MDLAEYTYAFPIGYEVERQYAGSTASVHFGQDGVKVSLHMWRSAPQTVKISDQFIPLKYRVLFTNVPGGCVPYTQVVVHVKSTLRIVERLINDEHVKSKELADILYHLRRANQERNDHRAKMKSMASTINEINDVLRKL